MNTEMTVAHIKLIINFKKLCIQIDAVFSYQKVNSRSSILEILNA